LTPLASTSWLSLSATFTAYQQPRPTCPFPGSNRSATPYVPLVLRGASGLPEEEILAAIVLGVAKININTEVRRAYRYGLRGSLTASDSDDLTRHFGAARAAASKVARSKIQLFATTNRREKPRLPDESE
jgi:fructose/tagatose bisphosphate aldolase